MLLIILAISWIVFVIVIALFSIKGKVSSIVCQENTLLLIRSFEREEKVPYDNIRGIDVFATVSFEHGFPASLEIKYTKDGTEKVAAIPLRTKATSFFAFAISGSGVGFEEVKTLVENLPQNHVSQNLIELVKSGEIDSWKIIRGKNLALTKGFTKIKWA